MLQGERLVRRICIAKSLLASLKRPLEIALLLLAFFVCAYLSCQIPAAEEDVVAPWKYMESHWVTSVSYEPSDRTVAKELDVLSSSGQVDVRAQLYQVGAHGCNGYEASALVTAFAVPDLSDETLCKTPYNPTALGLSGLNGDSVLVSSAVAKRLGLLPGDAMQLTELNVEGKAVKGAKKVEVTVSGVFPSHGLDAGIVLDESRLAAFQKGGTMLFGNAPVSSPVLENSGGESVSRNELADESADAAVRLMPFFTQFAQQWIVALFALVVGVFYSTVCWRRERRSLYEPLHCIGFSSASTFLSFLGARFVTYLGAATLALACAVLALQVQYPLGFDLVFCFLAAVVLLVPSMLGAALVLAASLRAHGR